MTGRGRFAETSSSGCGCAAPPALGRSRRYPGRARGRSLSRGRLESVSYPCRFKLCQLQIGDNIMIAFKHARVLDVRTFAGFAALAAVVSSSWTTPAAAAQPLVTTPSVAVQYSAADLSTKDGA